MPGEPVHPASVAEIADAVIERAVVVHQDERRVTDQRRRPGRGIGIGGADMRVERPHREHIADRREAQDRKSTSELQSLMRISYAVFCFKKKTTTTNTEKQDFITDNHITTHMLIDTRL